jgi:hypothetical protein
MNFLIRIVAEADAKSIISILNPIITAGKYIVLAEPIKLKSQIDFIKSFPEQGIFNIAVTADNKVLGLQVVVPLMAASDIYNHVGGLGFVIFLYQQTLNYKNYALKFSKPLILTGFIMLVYLFNTLVLSIIFPAPQIKQILMTNLQLGFLLGIGVSTGLAFAELLFEKNKGG